MSTPVLLTAFVLAFAACGAAGCAPTQYVYVPQQNATAVLGGQVAAEYPIPPPPATAEGNVRIASFGVAELAPNDGSAGHIDAIHMRMSITNNGSTPFTIDTRDQRLDLEGYGMSEPAFASADTGDPPPIITVAPNGKRVIDLFFPLPPDLEAPVNLPAFDTLWRVQTHGQTVAERTPFERTAVETRPVYADVRAWGWGGPYWYDPYYAGWGVVVPPIYWRSGFVRGWRHPRVWRGGFGRGGMRRGRFR